MHPPPFQLELAPGLWLDARRAVWLEAERVLAVADLHLGYPWAQRQAGHLFPVSAPEDTLTRLLALRECYHPRRMLLLGDIVHRAVLGLPRLGGELETLLTTLGATCEVTLAGGNHDRHLENLFASLHLNWRLESQIRIGPHILLHGDAEAEATQIKSVRSGREADGGFIIIGHEHPAIRIGDGVATSARCPCFLVSSRVLVLPAFSSWAPGTVFTQHQILSPVARNENFTRAVAIVSGRLLPVPLAAERAG